MKNGLIVGSFDPVTIGHFDIIKRACTTFDKVTVAILDNNAKKYMFTKQQRYDMLKNIVKDVENVNVICSDKLAFELANELNAVVIKGIRSVVDYGYELEMSLINKKLGKTETMLFFSSQEYLHISSSLARELILLKKDLSGVLLGTTIDYIEKIK